MEQLKTYWDIVKKGWWIIFLTVVAAVAISLLYSYLSTPVYRSTSRYIVSPNANYADESDFFRSLDTLDQRSIIATYAEVFGSNRVFAEALATLDKSLEDMEGYTITAVGLPEANIVEVAVEGSDPATLIALADAAGDSSTAYISDLYFLYEITLLDSPIVPKNPISPTPLRDAMIATILGLAAGVGLAILYALITDKESHKQDTEELSTLSAPQIDPAAN